MGSDAVIGIDLGTTNSVAAIVENGKARVISDTGGSYLIPSIVAIDEKGNRLVGQAAKRQLLINPLHTVHSAKRLIGREFHSYQVKKAKEYVKYKVLPGEMSDVIVRMREETYGLDEVSAIILDYVRNTAQDRLGREINRAVVTVPAYFNDRQRQAVRDAGDIAKLEIIRIVNEPTAAALAYGYGKGLRQKLAIYDLGGGTFDISILEVRDKVFEVRATGGDTFLGGIDFDKRLVDWVFHKFEKDYKIDLSKDPMAHQRVLDACENAKIQLSGLNQVRIHIPFITMSESGPLNIDLSITRDEFEELTSDLVDKTLKTCERVLDDARLSPKDIDSVLLVGGSTRMPMVSRKVEEFFGKSPSKAVHPDEAVALGAALLADALVRNDTDLMLLDVLPITIGIRSASGKMVPIFERNSPVPNQKLKVFTTSKDNQDSLKLTMIQGDPNNVEEWHPIGEFNFTGIRQAPKGQAKVEVKFYISPEGILSLTARDPDTGVEQKSTIKVESGLTKIRHKDLITLKKPLVEKPAEKLITRTVVKEVKLKSGQTPAPTQASKDITPPPSQKPSASQDKKPTVSKDKTPTPTPIPKSSSKKQEEGFFSWLRNIFARSK